MPLYSQRSSCHIFFSIDLNRRLENYFELTIWIEWVKKSCCVKFEKNRDGENAHSNSG